MTFINNGKCISIHEASASQMPVTCVAHDQSSRGHQDLSRFKEMATEQDPSIVQALTTLAGVLSPLARVTSNSTEEGTWGASSSNLSGPQHCIPGHQSGPSTSEGASSGW